MTREESLEILDTIPTIHEQVDALEMAIEALENQKTGHWIDDEFGAKCSCCNKHTHLDKFDRSMRLLYCSFCGAKMEGE